MFDGHMYDPDWYITPGNESEQKLINTLIWLKARVAFLLWLMKTCSSILISAPMSSRYSFDWVSSWRQTCQHPMGFNLSGMQSSFPKQITLISQTHFLCFHQKWNSYLKHNRTACIMYKIWTDKWSYSCCLILRDWYRICGWVIKQNCKCTVVS